MIRAVSIKNFKNIKDQRIELDRLTVFVGANGSGKTSVLEAIDRAVHTNIRQANFKRDQIDWIYTRGGSEGLSIGCETDDGGFEIKMTPPSSMLDISIPSEAELSKTWTISYKPVDGEPSEKRRRGAFQNNTESFYKAQKSALPLVFLQLNAARLAEPSYAEIARPRIQPDGSGVASVLGSVGKLPLPPDN